MATSFLPTRRAVTRSLALGIPAFGLVTLPALAQAQRAAGYSPAGIEAVEARLVTMPTTAFMVVASGRIAYSYGDIAQNCYLASARKSILSMLYGKYVANGTI